MQTATQSNSLMKGIDELDFAMVKLKLQDVEEGQGWSVELSNEAEQEYKKFLALKRKYPIKEVVSNKIVDLFWHQHILDTEKYAKDCQQVFGYFVHHFPYFGMSGAKDKQNLIDAFEETKRLYSKHFAGELGGKAVRCQAPKCRTQCKPMKCR